MKTKFLIAAVALIAIMQYFYAQTKNSETELETETAGKTVTTDKSVAVGETETVTISSIKVIIDDHVFSWKEKNEELEYIPEDEESFDSIAESLRVKPETVLTYTSLVPGKKITLSSLENEVTQTKLRLLNCGLFYTATVNVAPPRKQPEKRTVVITVTGGFLPRFGGGGIFAVFGKDGLAGKRAGYRLYFGWNKNGAGIYTENAFGLPLIFYGEGMWNGPASIFTSESDIANDPTKANHINFIGGAGFFITPNLRLCSDTTMQVNFTDGIDLDKTEISPYLRWVRFYNEKVQSDSEARFHYFPSSSSWSTEAATSVNWKIAKYVTFAGMASCGYAGSNVTAFKLYGGEKVLSSNSAFTNRAIRSGYNKEELTMNKFVMTSAEIRFNCFTIPIPPSFSCRIQPFLYGDIAYGENTLSNAPLDVNGSNKSPTNNVLDGFGGGVRLLFDNPIFAYFTFSYGTNHENKPLFCFSGTAGF